LVAGEEQSRQYVGSFQGKSHREHDPHSDGLLAPSGGFKPPLFDRFHSGVVEILVSGRALNKDILDSACVADTNFQQRRSLKALSSCRLRIAGFDLIPTERPGSPTVAAEPCTWWQTGYACPTTCPGPPGPQSGTARAAAPATSSRPRHDSYISFVKKLAGASCAPFHRQRRRSVRRSLSWWPQDITTDGSLGSRRQWHG
jgi:hypothetical protein